MLFRIVCYQGVKELPDSCCVRKQTSYLLEMFSIPACLMCAKFHYIWDHLTLLVQRLSIDIPRNGGTQDSGYTKDACCLFADVLFSLSYSGSLGTYVRAQRRVLRTDRGRWRSRRSPAPRPRSGATLTVGRSGISRVRDVQQEPRALRSFVAGIYCIYIYCVFTFRVCVCVCVRYNFTIQYSTVQYNTIYTLHYNTLL